MTHFTRTYINGIDESLNKHNIETKSYFDKFIKDEKYCFDIYVIDVQNGFMENGECGVMEADDSFIEDIISFLNKITDDIMNKIKTGYQLELRLFFSRDYHHPNHNSFKSEEHPNGFPAHCQFGTSSSAFHPLIEKWIIEHSYLNITILFKAFHPNVESFSVIPYVESIYPAIKRQGTCLNSYQESCQPKHIMTGGGVYFPDMHISTALKTNPFGDMITSKSSYQDIKKNAEKTLDILINGNSFNIKFLKDTNHYNMIVGLAGDFCVRDTIINQINQAYLTEYNNTTLMIYNLTRFVALPIGNIDTPYAMTKDGLYVNKNTTEKDSINGKYFIWTTTPDNLIKDYVDTSICAKPPLFSYYPLFIN